MNIREILVAKVRKFRNGLNSLTIIGCGKDEGCLKWSDKEIVRRGYFLPKFKRIK